MEGGLSLFRNVLITKGVKHISLYFRVRFFTQKKHLSIDRCYFVIEISFK